MKSVFHRAAAGQTDRARRVALLAIGVALCGVAWDSADAQETLRQLAERKGVVVGAMILDDTWQTAQQQTLVASEFRAATVGTFWTRTHPQPNTYDWSVTDAAVQWADAQGMAVHLHPLLYPADQFNPQWVRDQLDSNPEAARALLTDHITTAMSRYKGVVDVWDVVNEAVDPSGGYRPSKWKTALESIDGIDNYVVEAFRIARQVDPDAVLLYNEHDIELSNGYQSNKWFWTKQVLEGLIAENLVDGLGWQLHTTPDEVLGNQFALADRMQWVLDQGLQNYVTELDMEITPGADLDRQGEAFEEVAKIWLAKSGGGWLQTWGVYDGQSWLGPEKRPLLFDDRYEPKPAYDGVRDALHTVPDATPGDYNGDGEVGSADYELWRSTFSKRVALAGLSADGNADGVVNAADYTVWRDRFFGEESALPTPSPGSIALTATGYFFVGLTSTLRSRKAVFSTSSSVIRIW